MPASPNRRVGLVMGVGYLLFGLLSFTVTAQVGFMVSEGGMFVGLFSVNPLHNIVHVVIGAALLMAAFSDTAHARTATTAVGSLMLLLGGVGVYAVGSTANILAINAADNAIHFASAAVLLAAGLGTDQPTRAAA